MGKKAAAKKIETAGAPIPHKTIPTYPLSPTEIEMIIYTRWDGASFAASERATNSAISLEGDALRTFVLSLPFDPAYKPIESRMVEFAPANDTDTRWLMDRAHRIQLVSSNGKLPADLDNSDWRPGKPGVAKDDGVGILLVRPIA